eukprot:jgi/Ulvmu1/4033/UM019_0010.1
MIRAVLQQVGRVKKFCRSHLRAALCTCGLVSFGFCAVAIALPPVGADGNLHVKRDAPIIQNCSQAYLRADALKLRHVLVAVRDCCHVQTSAMVVPMRQLVSPASPACPRSARSRYSRQSISVQCEAIRSMGGVKRSRVSRAPTCQATRRPAQSCSVEGFKDFYEAAQSYNLVPLYRRIMSDQITPVGAYQSLTHGDRNAPSFLFESVQNGTDTGRFSFVGAWPDLEILGVQNKVTVLDHCQGTQTATIEDDPLSVVVDISRQWRPAPAAGLPEVFSGGWVGFTGYDTVRYTYPTKIPFASAPKDDRSLLDMHLALYKDMAIFDSATKLVYLVSWSQVDSASHAEVAELFSAACSRLADMEETLLGAGVKLLDGGAVDMDFMAPPKPPDRCNMTKPQFLDAVEATKEHIRAGDVFQLVLSQRFERSTFADPFDIYRALRIVNPSPYMVYLQARSCILVASSPEILCRVAGDREVTNRPLAGTRHRGSTPDEDAALEADLLADAKERAEHIMLVDLGRNDVGRVAAAGSVRVSKLMDIERYSHVMHISSTVKGKLRPELDAWDALRAALPVGTISGAPKVRAMQIIDQLEVNRRGPYGGGFGHVSFTGTMDIALALRTMVIPTNPTEALFQYDGRFKPGASGSVAARQWEVHLQAGAGLVADSDPEAEYQETVNKANGMTRAIDLAEHVFLRQ